MKSSDELRYDHEVLRGKLYLLEEHLPCLSIARPTLTSIVDSLSAWLLAHAQREERVFAARATERPIADMLPKLEASHDRQLSRLAILHELFMRSGPIAYDYILTAATALIQDFREQMIREEQECFPVIDRVPDEGAEQCVDLA